MGEEKKKNSFVHLSNKYSLRVVCRCCVLVHPWRRESFNLPDLSTGTVCSVKCLHDGYKSNKKLSCTETLHAESYAIILFYLLQRFAEGDKIETSIEVDSLLEKRKRNNDKQITSNSISRFPWSSLINYKEQISVIQDTFKLNLPPFFGLLSHLLAHRF